MRYVGVAKRLHSDTLGDISILKYVAEEGEGNVPYCDCDRCGKPIKRVMYVVQDDNTDVEMFYLGAECVKYII